MKKLAGALLATGLSSGLLAAPFNNPAASSQYDSGLFTAGQSDYTVRVGYMGDFVMNRYLKDTSAGTKVDASIARKGIVATLGFFDRFDLFLGAGQASFNDAISTPYPLVDGAVGEATINVRNANFWTLGARGTVWSQGDVTVNAFADYTHMSGSVDDAGLWGDYYSYRNPGFSLKSSEYQLGFGLSKTIEFTPELRLIPGISLRYSSGTFKFGHGTLYDYQFNDLKADQHVGVGLSCGLYAGKFFGLNLETQLLDSTGFAVTADVRL